MRWGSNTYSDTELIISVIAGFISGALVVLAFGGIVSWGWPGTIVLAMVGGYIWNKSSGKDVRSEFLNTLLEGLKDEKKK